MASPRMVTVGLVAALLVGGRVARADDAPAPTEPAAPAPTEARPPPPPFVPEIAPEAPPRANRGFQAGLRTGISLPSGLVAGRTKLADEQPMNEVLGLQVPLFLEAGWKVIPNLFLGGYASIAFGGSDYGVCNQSGASCATRTTRFGAQIQLHIAPAEQLNPWVGYGLGGESVTVSHSIGGCSSSAGASGIEWGHFMGGIDFRPSRYVGFGPFFDFSAGTYTSQSQESDRCDVKPPATRPGVGGDTFANGSVDNTATHYWLTIGARAVLLP